MKPLIVLLSVFAISAIVNKLFRGNYEFALSGRIAMSSMLVFTSVAHFVFTKGMSMMLPDFMLFKTETVYLTGIIEIAAAIGLFIPKLRVITAGLIIVFFIFILPANIFAAIKQVDYQNGTFDGKGLAYLWFRVPLQLFFIVWTYLSAIRR